MYRARTIHIKIRDVQWTAVVYTPKTYIKKFGADSRAICEFEKKKMSFRKDKLDFQTVIHEIVHALVDTSHTHSAELNNDQFEEVICDLVGEHIFDIFRWSLEVYNFISKENVQ